VKRVFVILLSILLIISVSGCDESLRIVGMEIEKYPTRIVYYAGVDKELDLTGGVVNYIHKGKSKRAADNLYITMVQKRRLLSNDSCLFRYSIILLHQLEIGTGALSQFPFFVSMSLR
jgi:hypothetical protein